MFCSHDVCVVLATCPASEHHGVGVGSAAVDVLQSCLRCMGLAAHVGIKSVVPSSQPEQNNPLWSVQFVEAV